jgi:Arc/MetJ-type ribon-helix-helix transcriptional regulator
MAIELDPKIEERIKQEVESGRFENPQELVTVAVEEYLREPDVLKAYTREEIEEKIDRGLADIEAGRVYDGEEVFQRLREKSAAQR